ncbi:hypothetical protein DPMN_178131 [Dreissena polymorpha]|uniref:Uncharacterized protein n=1 Tax=Dreissena polymorpha TaxID=45954 RepID=A0A9D4EEE5_DREPO|nr:hypothetical protein DPMN_178131 [Dreissena polymorpha]
MSISVRKLMDINPPVSALKRFCQHTYRFYNNSDVQGSATPGTRPNQSHQYDALKTGAEFRV